MPLGERIESAWRCWFQSKGISLDLSSPILTSACGSGAGLDSALIVSHPHGQSKKITLGVVKAEERPFHVMYNAATCPGSSGAPVFKFDSHLKDGRCLLWFTIVHSGSYVTTSAKQQGPLSVMTRFYRKLSGRKNKLNKSNYGNFWLLF